jgi:hypothetical protein
MTFGHAAFIARWPICVQAVHWNIWDGFGNLTDEVGDQMDANIQGKWDFHEVFGGRDLRKRCGRGFPQDVLGRAVMTPFFPCIKPRVVIPDELRHVEPTRSRTGIDIHPLKPEIKEWCQENLRNRYRTHFIKGEELGKMIAVIVFKAAKDAMLFKMRWL